MSYQVWCFTQAGAKAAYLENAFDIRRTERMNEAPSLSFSLPADDAKASYITSAYDVKIWNTVKEQWEGLYLLGEATEKWDGSGSVIEAYYTGVMAQLVKEDNVTYDTTSTPKTPTQIVTALLALQERTPAITVGTIQPTTSFAFAVENTNLLAALLKCVEYLGGYIEVDASRALNWYNDPSGDPVREIRYKKNLKGVTRKRDFTGIVNKLYAYGSGETEAQVTLVDAGEANEYIENAASQATYGVQIGRITDKRITHASTLLRWAQKVLAEVKDPLYYYTVDVVNLAEHADFDFDYENLAVGQIVRVVNSDLNNLNVDVKIVSVETDLSRPENIQVELANATKTLADTIGSPASKISLAENMAVQIGAGQVTVQGTFTVDGWRTAGSTTIDGGQITADTITCDRLKTSTLNAKTITLGTTGGDSIIKSGNYVAGTSGWQIKADGTAEFGSVTVRGNIETATLTSGKTLTVAGNIQSSDFDATHGWQISGVGSATFHIDVTTNVLWCTGISCNGSVYTNYCYLMASPTISGALTTPDGLALRWTDKNGSVHTITMS